MIVTTCGKFQFAGVNVSEVGATVPSVTSLELSDIVTSLVGCVFSTTVKIAVCPASLVTRPLVGVTVIPTVSSSTFVTATSAALYPE